METKLRMTLEESEHLLWFGQPTKGKLFQGPDKTTQYITWGIVAIFALFTVVFFIPDSVRIGRDTASTIIAIVVMNFLPLIIALRPFLDQRLLERSTIYAITDQRILVLAKDNVLSLPREGLTSAIHCRDGSAGNLCFNSAISAPLKKSRANAVVGCRNNGRVEGLIFYHISNPDEVCGILSPG